MPNWFLTDAEKERLNRFPTDVSQDDLVTYFTLSDEDKAHIPQTSAAHNRLGFALQLCVLRYVGFSPDNIDSAGSDIIEYVAQQIDVNPKCLSGYGDRPQTRTDHLQQIQDYLGFRKAKGMDLPSLTEWLVKRALEHDKPTLLFRLACERLHRKKIVRPGVSRIEKLVATARQQAQQQTYHQLQPLLTQQRQTMLDQLLVPSPETNRTLHYWLRDRSESNSPPAILMGLQKLSFLQQYEVASWNLTPLNPNRLKFLAQLGRKSTNQILQRMAPERRYPILLVFLQQSLIDITDDVIEMYDRCLADAYARAKGDVEEFRKKVSRATNEKVLLLGELSTLLSKPEIAQSGEHLKKAIYNWISTEQFKTIAQECKQIARPKDGNYFDYWAKRYNYFRIFSRDFINAFQFQSNRQYDPIIAGIELLKELNENNQRAVPDDAPTGFATGKWESYVFTNHGRINRHYWELCLLWELRNSLRSGDIWLKQSRRYANPETYLIPVIQWPKLKQEVCEQINAPAEGSIRLQERVNEVKTLLEKANRKLSKKNGKVRIENGKLVITPLEAEELPQRVVRLQQMVSERLPKVELSDLLIEVDSWTHFSSQFEHAGGSQSRNADLLRYLYAGIQAQASNFGLSQLADIAHLSYDRLAWMTNWYIREDTLKAGNTILVNYHHNLAFTRHWGGGTLSSSDGQRFPVTVPSKKAVALPRYFGYGKGVTFYTWSSDQLSQYGNKVVVSTVRDATYVLDAILDNETDLDIVEHTTDTAGYTELVFALFDLLGLQFSPRIRDIADQQLYRVEKGTKYPRLEPLLKGTINLKLIENHWDDLLRLAGSLKLGWVTASLMINKLQSHPKQNMLTKALIEYGRLEKTRFILKYLLSEKFRRRISLQLNKGEAIHALRGRIFFANEGKIRKGQDEAQTNQLGCLTLVTNAVIVWNTVYMQEVINQLKSEGYKINESDLKHLLPARYEHINPYGRYEFKVDEELRRRGLRPLRKPK